MEQLVNIAAQTGDKTIVIVIFSVAAAVLGFVFVNSSRRNNHKENQI